MMQRQYARLGGASSLLSFALGLGSFVLVLVSNPPTTSASEQRLAKYLTNNQETSKIIGLFSVFGGLLDLVFFVALWGLLREAEGGRGVLAALALLGGLARTVLAWVATAVTLTVAFMSQAAPAGILAFNNLNGVLVEVSHCAEALPLAAASVVTLDTGLFRPWLGWVGLLGAAGLLFAGAGQILGLGGTAVIGWAEMPTLVWWLAITLTLLRWSGPPSAPPR